MTLILLQSKQNHFKLVIIYHYWIKTHQMINNVQHFFNQPILSNSITLKLSYQPQMQTFKIILQIMKLSSCLYFLSNIENMILKLALSFILFYLASSYCSSTCATCANPTSTFYSSTCYSCSSGYFLYNSRCYSCSSCESYDRCSSCESSGFSSGTIVIIVVSIVGGISFILFVAKCVHIACTSASVSEVNDGHQVVVSAANLIQIPSVSAVQFKHKWIHDTVKFSSSENCAICLDSNVFLQTKCHHYFHPNCIWQWSTKKQSDCPLCKSKSLYPSKIYCQSCYEQYYEVDKTTIPVVIREGKWKKCLNCKQL